MRILDPCEGSDINKDNSIIANDIAEIFMYFAVYPLGVAMYYIEAVQTSLVTNANLYKIVKYHKYHIKIRNIFTNFNVEIGIFLGHETLINVFQTNNMRHILIFL